jgi:hypothetical protein
MRWSSFPGAGHRSFVVHFATTDFEKLCEKPPPPVDDLARIWEDTGMPTSEERPKPALVTRDADLKAEHSPTTE